MAKAERDRGTVVSRAAGDLSWRFRFLWTHWREYMFGLRGLFDHAARPAYCCICGCWSWSTWERAPYSTGAGFLCEECAEDNDKELEAERQDVYGYY